MPLMKQLQRLIFVPAMSPSVDGLVSAGSVSGAANFLGAVYGF